jgi:hypothetical protein
LLLAAGQLGRIFVGLIQNLYAGEQSTCRRLCVGCAPRSALPLAAI